MNELVPIDTSAVTVALSEDQVRELYAELELAVAAMEMPIKTLREWGGIDPAPIIAHLAIMLNMGAGYYRHGRDSIARAYRARNSHEAQSH